MRIELTDKLPLTSRVNVELHKLLFGLSYFKIEIPCIHQYFGSCSFHLCDFISLMGYQQHEFCKFLQFKYNKQCSCESLLNGTSVIELNQMKYNPSIKQVKNFVLYFKIFFEIHGFLVIIIYLPSD